VPIRVMVFAIMLGSLVMSASIPEAFGAHGLWFALAYVAIQVMRSFFVSWVMWQARPVLGLSLLRVSLWFVASAPLWIVGGLSDPVTRLWLWSAALGIEYLGPIAQFAVPGLSRSKTTDYAVSGAHMAERCALLIIIALGEGILVTGATFSDLEWTGPTIGAALIAFLGSVAMWWVYFDVGMRRGSERIQSEEDSGRIARNAYTYCHLPIVAGIVVTAVADEMLMKHPTGHASAAFLWSLLGGSALFLGGSMVFKRVIGGTRLYPLSHVVGLTLLAFASVWAVLAEPTPLAVGAVGVAILFLVTIWEWGSYHGGWVERGVRVPPPLRRYVAWRSATGGTARGAADKPVFPAKDQG
ncbi:MAG: low temperature requirement protein A, partial [Sphingomicrobium sp.]